MGMFAMGQLDAEALRLGRFRRHRQTGTWSARFVLDPGPQGDTALDHIEEAEARGGEDEKRAGRDHAPAVEAARLFAPVLFRRLLLGSPLRFFRLGSLGGVRELGEAPEGLPVPRSRAPNGAVPRPPEIRPEIRPWPPIPSLATWSAR